MVVHSENMFMLPDVNNDTVIIGNHPDELSEIIPIITRKLNAAFFVLIPCCAVDIHGKRLPRRNSGISVYEDMLITHNEWSKAFGFMTEIDRLHIPSTKRIAILGAVDPTTFDKTQLEVECRLQDFIEDMKDGEAEREMRGDPPRGIVLPPMNCTRLPRQMIQNIKLQILGLILYSGIHFVERDGYLKPWNAGGQYLRIDDVVLRLGRVTMCQLKAQNKGMQTFLRNHGDIFTIHNSFIRLRIPTVEDKLQKEKEGKEKHFQTKPCFIQFFHPSGCPLSRTDCVYSHDLPRDINSI